MIRLLYVGDPHLRGGNPRNRTDDYKEALFRKWREVFAIAKANNVQAIIEPGDTFDRPEVSSGVLDEFADLLMESPAPIYTTPGNHDLYSYNIDTYKRTSLNLLERMVPHFHVKKNPGDPTFFERDGVVVQLTFTPYSSRMDKDGYGYSHEVGDVYGEEGLADPFKIHVAHGMLLDLDIPYAKYTHVRDVVTNADLVLCGHDHTGFGIYNRPDGKVFINEGSLTRLSASRAEMERDIKATLIKVGSEKRLKLESIKLASAEPGEKVLDRSAIEANTERQYAMETFAALLQNENGESVAVDIDAIIASIAKAEGINEKVVRIALSKIANIRGELV